MLNIEKIEGKTDLFLHYPIQSHQQPCYVALDCDDKKLTAGYNNEIGNAIPFSVFRGRTQRWTIPCLTADAANELLDEIAPLARQVLGGYESVWDGSNWDARFSESAEEVIEQIYHLCEGCDGDLVQAWDAEDYFFSAFAKKHHWVKEFKIDEKTTDDELDKLADNIVKNEAEYVDVFYNLNEFLESLRESAIETAD